MKIRLELRAVTTVNVGGAFAGSFAADIPFYTTPQGEYAIPGSAIKGVLRTIASNIAQKHNLVACGIIDPEELAAHARENPCDVCRLFGVPGNENTPIRVGYFKPINAPPAVLTRIKINPKTGTVERGAMYEIEVLPPCTVFRGTIKVYEGMLGDKRDSLIVLLLDAIKNLRFNRLGRGDSVFDVLVMNVEELRERVPAASAILDDLSDWFWKDLPCGGAP